MASSEADLDKTIIQSYLNGDNDAFGEVVTRYERPIYNLAYRMTGNVTDAADLTQEIFIHLHRKVAGFRGDAAFSTWLYRLAINYSKDWLRKEGRRAPVVEINEEIMPDSDAGPGQLYEKKEVQELVQSAILTLPEDQRIAIILHDIQGYNYEEIADITGVPIGTVKSRLARARLKLAEKLVWVMEQPGRINV